MAGRTPSKYTSTAHATYQRPYRDQTDYKYYQPQVFVSNYTEARALKKNTAEWFQDYRRTSTEEKVLRYNLRSLKSPLKPTPYSDKPDIAMGARKNEHESLKPVTQNKPPYTLTNQNHDRLRDRDAHFTRETLNHRNQYQDMTESLHKKVETFYIPFSSAETFKQRDFGVSRITGYPEVHKNSVEYVYDKKRAKPMVRHNKTNVSI